jgi:hypothetical protein
MEYWGVVSRHIAANAQIPDLAGSLLERKKLP